MHQVPSWSAHEWTSVAGTRMHAALAGSRGARSSGEICPPREVVLVAGLGCSHRYFRRLAAALAPDAHVAAVDLPGAGRTAARGRGPAVRAQSWALADWLRATGRQGAVLVGHSAGCHVVADLARHAPDLMGPVVLAAPVDDGRRRPWLRHIGRLLLAVVMDGPRLFGTWVTVIVDALSSGPVRDIRQFHHLLDDPLPRTARELAVRTVVVRGVRDPVSPSALVRDIAAAAPCPRLVEVPGAGHLVHWTHPRAIADEVLALLAR